MWRHYRLENKNEHIDLAEWGGAISPEENQRSA
jgi:hypothetical protein